MTVKIYKLSTAEEIIGEHVEGTTLRKIRQLGLHPENGKPALMPWLVLSQDTDIKIEPSHIVAEIEASLEVEKSYRQAVSSIQLAA